MKGLLKLALMLGKSIVSLTQYFKLLIKSLGSVFF